MTITALLATLGLTWPQLLTLGVALVRAAAELATSSGVTDAEFRKRHSEAMLTLGAETDAMLARLRLEANP